MRDFHQPNRSMTLASNGMVATSHPLAASVALDTLKQGGNAMDAAIAGAAVLGICEPQMCGLGGDLFALWSRAPSDDLHALNASGRAPAAIDPDALAAGGQTRLGDKSVHSVTIPGAVDGFCSLHASDGRLPLDQILTPAIHYAEEGVPVAPRVAFDWSATHEQLQGVARDHYTKAGKPLQLGDVFRAPGIAEVWRRIARDGRDAFYDGEVAQDMLDALTTLGGTHCTEDFLCNSADVTTAISATYGTAEVCEHPPNGQGAAALLILNILKHFDIASLDPLGAQRLHLEAEATKLAYGLRNQLIADGAPPDKFLDPKTAEDLAARIDPHRAGPFGPPISGAPHRDTIYITVVDRDRMAVSLIHSIFSLFGCGIASPKFGILFHNRGTGFTLRPGHPNQIGPKKRPLHTIIPGLVRRGGKVSMPFGVMGGQYQATGHARLISNIEAYGMDIQAAIEAPRAFAEDGTLKVERGYSDAVRSELADMGHSVVIPDGPLGGAQAIRIDDTGVLFGGSDPRKDGCALGY